MKFYRFLTAAILTLLLSFGLPVFAADNALSLDTENSVLDSTKGVRLFSDDFTTKDTQITDFDSVLLNSIAISFPKCDFGNVVPYSGGYVTIGYSDRVDQTLVRFDFNDNGSGFAFSGGTFTAGESEEGFQVMDNPGQAKYGMTRPQLTEAFRKLKAMGAKRFGIHAFLASNTLSNDYYPALAGILFQLAVDLERETGADVAFINLSGGVGIPYRPDQPENDIMAIGAGVRDQYESILVPAGMGDVAIFTELGRYLLGPNGCLVTTAIREKHTYKEYIGVDACAANLMRPAMYGAYHHITVMGKEDAPCDHKYDVVGSLCENNDKFAIDRMLPRIDRGDLLVLHDTGAHGFSMGYNYNGKLRSAELLLQADGGVRLIRRAETPEDYFATMVFD